jgi:hypothetical protein
MRKLNAGDLFKFAKMMGKALPGIDELDTDNPAETGKQIFSALANHCVDDLADFLASVSEIDRSEFDSKPFDYPLEVIEHIINSGDYKAFFTRLPGLLSQASRKGQ